MSRYVTKPHHLQRYVAPDDLQARFDEVCNLVERLMGMNLSPKLKKLMIDTALYQVAHLRGGYKGRYRSQSVLDAANNQRSEPIQLDHVFQRKHWIQKLNAGTPIAEVAHHAFCCVVTKTDHLNLEQFRNFDGWDRYRQAGIPAFDMSVEPPVPAY